MRPESLHVAVATDARYVPHTAAMLRSLARSQAGAGGWVHLLHGPDLTPRDLDGLQAVVQADPAWGLRAHLIPPDMIEGLPAWDRIPATMWYRIRLPELLPEADRVLYLDVDVLIRQPLAPLFEIDLDGAYVGAVTNVPMRHMLGHAAQLGLSGPERYFNSGVLLMNLPLMRHDGITEQLVDCARERAGRLLWPDQDALNLVVGDRRLALHPRWNLMNSIRCFDWSDDLLDPREVREARGDPAIVHFEGPSDNKPWHLLCESPYRHEYLGCRRETPWPRVRWDGVTPANVLTLARRRVGRAVRAGTAERARG